jgi:hypothetical protein
MDAAKIIICAIAACTPGAPPDTSRSFADLVMWNVKKAERSLALDIYHSGNEMSDDSDGYWFRRSGLPSFGLET